jgi:uncharacterized protein
MAEKSVSRLFSGPPGYVPSSPWGVFGSILGTIVVAASALLVITGVVAVLTASGFSDAEVDAQLAATESLARPEGVALVAGTQIASLIALWLFARRDGQTAKVLGLAGPHPNWPIYLAGGVILLAVTGAIEYLMYAATKFDIFADAKWLREGLQSPYWWGTVVIAVVLAPLWEELTFRGFLLSGLAQSPLGFWGAALVSNLAWTLLHWGYSLPGMVSVFAGGAVFTWLVWRTGSVRPAIVAHAIGNAAALAFMYKFGPPL